MKIITIANQKGGVGKTSILFHLASYLTRAGRKCLVIDIDPQGNATSAMRKHTGATETGIEADRLLTDAIKKIPLDAKESPGPFICPSTRELLNVEKKHPLQEIAKAFQANIKLLGSHDAPQFDYALIDTGPQLSDKMGAALFVSDFVISPVEMEEFAIDGLAMMLDTIETFKRGNPKLHFLGLVPNKVQKEYHHAMLKKLQKMHPGITIPYPVGNRDSIREAISKGVPVWKINKTAARKAAKEMIDLGDYILNALEKSNGKKPHD